MNITDNQKLKRFIHDELESLRKKSLTTKGVVKATVLAKAEAYAKVAGYMQGLEKEDGE